MIFNELIILKFQIAAAVFMGWDYLMPKSWRQIMDETAGNFFTTAQQNTDNKIFDIFGFIKNNYQEILLLTLGLILTFLIYIFVPLSSKIIYPESVLIIQFICIILFIISIRALLIKIMPVLVQLGIMSIFRVITTFLINTEKGPIAGIGFLCLLISFGMRYINSA